jgi:prepilin-type N-terminal cleavage/methylation domain-containing protein
MCAVKQTDIDSERVPGERRGVGEAGERGFSLLEVIVAMSILMVGLLGLAQVFYVGMSIVSTSSPSLVAREKAREAVESVHTARDTGRVTWAQIRNVNAPPAVAPNVDGGCPAGTTGAAGGNFVNGALAMRRAGPDGLSNTADDTGFETSPGPDNMLGTSDDLPISGFTRQIDICDINGNNDLRAIVVTIRFNGSGAIGTQRRSYVLTTYVSRFS